MRSPLTGVVFSLELTHAWPALLALLIASSSAYGVSTLLLRRSVLTEKIARRGYHLSREYDVDPLEVLFVDEVMHPSPATLRPGQKLASAAEVVGTTVKRPRRDHGADSEQGLDGVKASRQRLFPVLDANATVIGVVEAHELLGAGDVVADVMTSDPLVVSGDDTLRDVRARFAVEGVVAAPVVAPDGRLTGLLTIEHLLDGHLTALHEENHRERFLIPGRTGHSVNGSAGRASTLVARTGR